MKNLDRLEWVLLITACGLFVLMVLGIFAEASFWEKCRKLGGHKRAVGTVPRIMMQPVTNADGTVIYITTPTSETVFECLDANGRFIDVRAREP